MGAGSLALRRRSPAWPGQPRAPTAHPAPGAPVIHPRQRRRPRASFPHLLSGSPWPGARPVGPQTVSKNRAARRTEIGHANTVPTGPALLHRRLSFNLSLSLQRRRPAPPDPRPASARATVAPRLPGERAARRREGARSTVRMRTAARRDGAEGVQGWVGGAVLTSYRRGSTDRGFPSFPHPFSPSTRSLCRSWNGPLGIQQPGPWGGQGKESSDP